jgi:hypothetical protein
VQAGDPNGEAEAYAIRTAKAAFYVDSTGTPIDTSVKDLDAMLAVVNLRSPGFKAWLDGRVGPGEEPEQVKCMTLVGRQNADAEVTRLWAARKDAVQA